MLTGTNVMRPASRGVHLCERERRINGGAEAVRGDPCAPPPRDTIAHDLRGGGRPLFVARGGEGVDDDLMLIIANLSDVRLPPNSFVLCEVPTTMSTL